jgi:hypothetical protein
MPSSPLHPVPTERRALITALDKRQTRVSLDDMLRARGFDLALPYRQEPWEGEGDLYVQDIPPATSA